MHDHDRRHETSANGPSHGPGAATGAGPGKSTRVQELGVPPVASAASATSGLEGLQHTLDKENDKLLGKLVGKMVSTATDEAIKKLLGKLESGANDTLKRHLDPDHPECPDALTVRLVELAINTKRLMAALRLLQSLDKVVKAEIAELKSKDSGTQKFLKSAANLETAMKALASYADAMRTANGQYTRVHAAAAACRAKLNPNFEPMPVPQVTPQTKRFPELHLPPDIEKEKSPIKIVIGDGMFHIGV